MDIMDMRRSKLLCNNTMQMYIKRISLVRYMMIVLSCAKGSSYIRKKISHIINKWCQLFSRSSISLVLPTDTYREHCSIVLNRNFNASRVRGLTCGLRFELYICDTVPNTRYAIPLFYIFWPDSFIDRERGSY